MLHHYSTISLYHHVTISPLAYVPGYSIKRYLGQINLHFIRESWSVKGDGGIGAFYHETLMHAQAMCRAHVVAQGGNALTSFRLKVSKNYQQTVSLDTHHHILTVNVAHSKALEDHLRSRVFKTCARSSILVAGISRECP